MAINHKPSCNPQVGVPQYRLAMRQAVKANGGANFAQLFSVNEGLVKTPLHVTPSHLNRVWKLIEALVEVGCTNLCVNAKPFQEACKFEFNADPTALGPKPFQMMICDATDHITNILYMLRAFYRENRSADEIVSERAAKNKKTNKFRNMLTVPDHMLLSGLELRINLDMQWSSATSTRLALPAIPFSFSSHSENEALVCCRPDQNAPSRAASRASSFDSCAPTELDPTPSKFQASGKSLFSGFFGSEVDPNVEDDNPLYNIRKLSLFGPKPKAEENAGGQSSKVPLADGTKQKHEHVFVFLQCAIITAVRSPARSR